MIISRVRLNRTPGSQGTLAKVLLEGAAADQSHSLIWSLFDSNGDRKRDFVYRQIDEASFITVSPQAPEDAHNLWHIESKTYEPCLTSGQRLRFILRANPAISVRQSSGKRSARVDAVMHAKSRLSKKERAAFRGSEDAALDWLMARGAANGAEFDRQSCTATGYRQISIPKSGGREPIRFSEVQYEGMLIVADPDRLKSLLFKGIGKAKAYGCGLMLIRPA